MRFVWFWGFFNLGKIILVLGMYCKVSIVEMGKCWWSLNFREMKRIKYGGEED